MLLVAGLVLPGLRGNAHAQDPLTNRIETRHAIIFYQSADDLNDFDSAVDFSSEGFSLGGIFTSSPKGNELIDVVTRKVDGIYERVQEILDMQGQIPKVTLRLYPDRAALARAYQAFTGSSRLKIRAWYIYERNTIYLNVEDIHEGMLAHEIAHAIIDHYLTVRPPRATAEILARYVDEHLSW
jgi:hypothetical protein